MSDDLVKVHVRKWLAANVTVQESFREKIRELEASGLRIVDGGQTGSYGEDGRAEWEVTDWRTGDVVTSGRDTYEGFADALAQLDPDDRLVFLDRLSEETELPQVESTVGLPESLCDALVEWLEEKADAEEVAEWLGEPVEVIERQMRNEVKAARQDLEPAAE